MSEERDYLKEKEEKIDVDKEIERIAREQLLLKKEGEEVILISRSEKDEDIREKDEEEEKEKGFFENLSEFLPWR